MEHPTPRKLTNLALAGAQYALKRQALSTWPVIVKVDISPLCNLHCTICVHARPSEGSNPLLKSQAFDAGQIMSCVQFRRIVDEIAGKSEAVSLYYLGDPLVHPDLDAMCRITWQAGLNSHVNTNLSFNLSDDRLYKLVTSGLTHLTVCVDGLSQETYGRTRVGGRIAVVLDNLKRLIRCRSELGRVYPRVEVQYIKFQHNVGEFEEATRRFTAMGVDQISEFWGSLHNYTDLAPGNYRVFGPRNSGVLPLCPWPYFAIQIKYNGDVIPCCNYRLGLQYSSTSGPQDQRIIGNVFQTSLWEIWNSPTYRALRRFVSHPARMRREPILAETFCDGCPRLFDTDTAEVMRSGHKYHWEELYAFDNKGHVVRQAPAIPGPGKAP